MIQNYKYNHMFDISFSINNIPLGLANSLRRVLLSNIPVVAFNNKWDDNKSKRSIVIKSNTSGIHNEFLAHRLCLIPISMYNNNILKINTKFNKNNREFTFMNQPPEFKIQIQNNESTRTLKNSIDIIDVTTEDFQYNSDDFTDIPITDFFPRDNITDEYILINMLKLNNIDDSMGEKIDLVCKPTIGYGSIHSCYCPVGTVSFSFEERDEDEINTVFKQKIDYMNKEREKKGLQPISSAQKQKLKKSFNLLDRERVYKIDNNGCANSFNFRVESIGFLTSDVLVYDALSMLELKLYDIINSINISYKEERGNYNVDINLNENKINIRPTLDSLQGHIIDLFDENHTIGNCITDYMKHLYVLENRIDSDILKFVTYTMKHPLREQIEIKLKLKKNMDFKKVYRNTVSKFIQKSVESIYVEKDDELIKKKLNLLILYKTILYIIEDINHLKDLWTNLTGIIKTSFNILDEPEYISINKNLGHSFNFKEFDYGFTGNGNITPYIQQSSRNTTSSSFQRSPSYQPSSGESESSTSQKSPGFGPSSGDNSPSYDPDTSDN